MNTTTPSLQPHWLERLATTVTDVIFPPVCAGCGRLGTLLCEPCVNALVPVERPLCDRCGRGLTHHATPALCSTCAAEPPLLRQARAPLLYVDPTSKLIHRMKYDGHFALARPLAAIMAARWPVWDMPVDLILPIPLHPRRQRHRGYNQSTLLARHLAGALALPFDDKALRRHRHTQPQIQLGPEERRSNVTGAFVAVPERVGGRHIVLIDDVYTTGATTAAAAEALLAAGAASASAYCLARVS